MRFTLPKSKRLKGVKNIETLFQSGEAFFVHPYRIVYRTDSSIKETKVGFAVSKKLFRHAVGRNKIKRLTREVYRLQQNDLRPNAAIHFMLQYTSKEVVAFDKLFKSMGKILTQLNTISQKTIISNIITPNIIQDEK
jgi:ribonuclease P protein component